MAEWPKICNCSQEGFLNRFSAMVKILIQRRQIKTRIFSHQNPKCPHGSDTKVSILKPRKVVVRPAVYRTRREVRKVKNKSILKWIFLFCLRQFYFWAHWPLTALPYCRKNFRRKKPLSLAKFGKRRGATGKVTLLGENQGK